MSSKNSKVSYRKAQKQDLAKLAQIYCSLYTNSALSENWNQESAYELLHYFYQHNPEIFVVAEIDKLVIGAIMSLVKPWHDGNRLIETEVFVDSQYQKNGIGSKLFLEHFRLAIQEHNAKVIEAYTYEEPDGHPLSWYRKQGYEVIRDWFVINGEIAKVCEYLETH